PPRDREGDDVQVGRRQPRDRGRITQERAPDGSDSRCGEDRGQAGQGHRHAGRAHEQQRLSAGANTPRATRPAVPKKGMTLTDWSGETRTEPVIPKPRLLPAPPNRTST